MERRGLGDRVDIEAWVTVQHSQRRLVLGAELLPRCRIRLCGWFRRGHVPPTGRGLERVDMGRRVAAGVGEQQRLQSGLLQGGQPLRRGRSVSEP